MFPFTSFIYICKMTWGAVTIMYETAPHMFFPLVCVWLCPFFAFLLLIELSISSCWTDASSLAWWSYLTFDFILHCYCDYVFPYCLTQPPPPPKSLLHFLNPLSLNVPASVFAMHGWRLFKITQHMSGQIQSGLCWLVHFSFLSTLSHGLILWDKTVTTIMDSISEESSTILLCSVAFKVCRSHI